MVRYQRNRVIKIIVIVLSFLMLNNLSVTGQVEDLTDREILVQLIEKFCHFEETLKEVRINSDIVRKEIISIDKRIYRNSMEICNLSGIYESATGRWNALLGLFATFILGIFVFMWRKSYDRVAKRNK